MARHMWLLVCLIASATVAGAARAGVAQAPAELRLTDLTVPAAQLTDGCTTPPNEPIDQRGTTRLPAGATNPWSPTTPLDLAMVHRMVAAPPRVPDGPPPMPRDSKRFAAQHMPEIAEAYAAVYAGPGEPEIRVWGVRYTAAPPPDSDAHRRPFRIRELFTTDRVIVLVDASDRGACLDAVRAHVRRFMTR
jgi:hypothetical protein